MRLVADTRDAFLGTTLGVGVDENTALVIYGAGQDGQYAEVNNHNWSMHWPSSPDFGLVFCARKRRHEPFVPCITKLYRTCCLTDTIFFSFLHSFVPIYLSGFGRERRAVFGAG